MLHAFREREGDLEEREKREEGGGREERERRWRDKGEGRDSEGGHRD